MTDSRLYALVEHLRKHGVDVVPGLHWSDDYLFESFTRGPAWCHEDRGADPVHPDFARAAIVVWCLRLLDDLETDDEIGIVARESINSPAVGLLRVAWRRGIAVPEELKGESDEG